ncbi:3-keto-5-aminohexanoate cleavage protein [Nocardia sp. CWNU-33]|uniref:3-keto-5-aminohexanoate cleavage protein n=1 Tax=Nocardia sp. CWNU-33 TaxID=3392117 RepID=UPI00398E81F8
MLLKACINGPRLPVDHPRLVAAPESVAAEARSAVEAGARAIHLHPKSDDGHDSLAGADVDRYVAATRAACPLVPVGITTGAWSAPVLADRLAAIDSWTTMPDFASVNWHEAGADEVAERLLERGVDVEAGIWHTDGLAKWLVSPHRSRCLRVLVEIPDIAEVDQIEAAAVELIQAVRAVLPHMPVLLHGEDRSAWPALHLAAQWGLDTRIGLEDTLCLPDGSPAQDNEQLIRVAMAELDHETKS